MYECVSLIRKNLDCFYKLNQERYYFNPLNKDFFKEYLDSNFAKQISMRRKVKLIKYNSKYIGYIWIYNSNKNIYSINSINIKKGYDNTNTPYKHLICSISKKLPVNYICQKKNNNFSILESIGFTKLDGTLIFDININQDLKFNFINGLEFHSFIRGRDEALRCNIQNSIFENEGRIPLSIEDIYYDELQTYYFEKGAVFLKKNDEFIGYGQIILENKVTPVIVNFGILKEHRGKGYSKYLLKYLLKMSYLNGFRTMKIKVKSSNTIAANLYKSMGFKICNEIYTWKLENILP